MDVIYRSKHVNILCYRPIYHSVVITIIFMTFKVGCHRLLWSNKYVKHRIVIITECQLYIRSINIYKIVICFILIMYYKLPVVCVMYFYKGSRNALQQTLLKLCIKFQSEKIHVKPNIIEDYFFHVSLLPNQLYRKEAQKNKLSNKNRVSQAYNLPEKPYQNKHFS